MIDINIIREKPEEVKNNLKKRHDPEKLKILDKVIKLDTKWRQAQYDLQKLKAKKNQISQEINELKKQGKSIFSKQKELKELPNKVRIFSDEVEAMKNELDNLLIQIPNLLHETVPKGKDESENKELKKWGTPKEFDFALKNHVDLLEDLNLGDFDQARLVSGKGFNYLLGEMALLDLALQRYGVDFLLKKGFKLVAPPVMLNRKALGSAINLSEFEEVVYKVEEEDLYLIGTAEHSLVSFLKDRTFKKENLPLKLCAVTPCFRKEIGSHGVDTKGLFRMHQFNKVEQVIVSTPEDSYKFLEEMQRISESFFESLELPYRVVEMCGGDCGEKAAKQMDIEAWFPRQKAYREVTSASNCTDYQSRRLSVKYYETEKKTIPYLLNNTMVATSRAMVAILENYQQKDGTVRVPKVLEPYMNGIRFLGKK